MRNPLTISHGYRNIAASARLWHLAAAALVLTPIWIAPLALLAIGSANLADLDVAAGIFAWVAIELALTAVGGSIPFALIYLHRLYRGRIRGAEFYALAAWVSPRIAVVAFFMSRSLDGTNLPAIAIVAAAAICTLTMVAASARRRTPRTPPLAYFAAAGVALSIGALASTSTIALLDAMWSALFIGFGVYVMRNREQRFERDLTTYLWDNGDLRRPAPHDHTLDVIGNWRRLAVLLVAAVGAAAALATYRAASPAAGAAADSAFPTIAAVAVAATTGMAVAFALRMRFNLRIALNHGFIVAVIAMLVVAVEHVGGAFANPTDDEFIFAFIGGFAVSAVIAIALLCVAIMHPKTYNLRPFLLAFAWPGLLALAMTGATAGLTIHWHGAALAGILTLGTLWAIWYGTERPTQAETQLAPDPDLDAAAQPINSVPLQNFNASTASGT